MVTQLIAIEVDLVASAADLQRAIVLGLQKWGEPLRWAVTAVDPEQRKVHVEAVVTTE
jgi:hypothetical protein